MITDVLSGTPIDLGFNNMTDDSCDYWDYLSELTADSNHVVGTTSGSLGLLQLNISGVLGKQNLLKNLLNDVRHKMKVHMVMLVETWLKKKQYPPPPNSWIQVCWLPQEIKTWWWSWYPDC